MISGYLKEETLFHGEWPIHLHVLWALSTVPRQQNTEHLTLHVWNSVPVTPCRDHSPKTITTLAKEERHWCISGGYAEFTQTRNSFSLARSSTHQNCCRKMPQDKRWHTQLLLDKAQVLAPMVLVSHVPVTNTCLASSPAALLSNSPHTRSDKDLKPILYLST